MRAPLRTIWLTMTCLTAITLAACADSSPTIPSTTTSADTTSSADTNSTVAALPVARLDVTIDGRGSNRALLGASEVTFDMSGSTGSSLHYSVDFGDGASSSGTAVAKHVYPSVPYRYGYPYGQKTFTATGTVTDGFGKTQTVTKEVVVISLRGSDDGTWEAGNTIGSTRTEFIRFNTDGDSHVTGAYWSFTKEDQAIPTTPFNGTIGPDGQMSLVLDDGSIAFAGPIILKDYSGGRHLLLTIHGGSADGTTADFAYQDHF